MARRATLAGRLIPWLVLLAVSAPVLIFIAAIGSRFGWLSLQTGYDLLTQQVGWVLALVGAAAAVAAAILALRDLKRFGLAALIAVVAAGGTVGGFIVQRDRFATGGVEDVSSNPVDRPGFSESVSADRGGMGPSGSTGPETCPGVRPILTQVAPDVAAAALRSAGFTVRGAGIAKADGVREGFWFGFTHDAAVRIRPGRTDVRVAARDPRPHGGEACRLAAAIVEGLEAGR